MNSTHKILSHHSSGLVGNDSTRDQLISMLEKQYSIKIHGNPDFFNRKYDTFTIGDARELKSNHEMRPVNASGEKIFIITMNSITVEAQNALLKLLEEPADYAHFFLIVPSAHLLLPTVKSRMQFIKIDEIQNAHDSEEIAPQSVSYEKEAEEFLKSSVAKRIDFIKSLTDDIKDEKRSKQDAIDFIDTIQASIYKKEGVINGKTKLEAIETSRKYLNDSAPSIKILFEYIALNV